MNLNRLIIVLLLAGAGVAYAEQQQSAAPATQTQVTATKDGAAASSGKPDNKATAVDMETAYKREFAFLEAQKRELKQRLDAYKSKAAAEESKLDQKIGRLEQSSVDNAAEIDNLEAQLAEAERTAAALDERSEVLEMTFSQAETTLENYGVTTDKVPESQQSDDQKLKYLFAEALGLVRRLGDMRTETGKFYLRDGKETQGKIVKLGNIAAFGVSEQGNGALAPAGGDNMKLWKEPTADVARQLAANTQPDLLKIFLYESHNKAIDERPEKTWLSIIESGGIIGWVIVVLGGIGLLLILIRCYLLYMNSKNNKKITEQVVDLVAKGDLQQAKQVCSKESCAITRVLSSTLRHLKDDRDHMDDIVSEAILNESGPINRYGAAILVIASVAPLLGLLGTVTGMISTFDIITEFGTGDPKLLSSGISVALVTTELGLIVAIPTLMCGSLLTAWASDIKRDMEKSTLTITNAVLGGGNADIVRAINEQKTTGSFSANYRAA